MAQLVARAVWDREVVRSNRITPTIQKARPCDGLFVIINPMFEFIGLSAGVLASISYIPYVLDVIKQKAKPERATWLIYTALAAIALLSQVSKGATDSLWLTVFDSIGAIIIFLLSIKYGMGGFTKRDIRALIAAGIGLILWYVTRDAIYALLITMVIDAIGTALTVIKTYEQPSTETYTVWLLVSIASILAMISVGSFDITLLAYPFYIFLANFSVVMAKFLAENRILNQKA